jgi:hypothetical protein
MSARSSILSITIVAALLLTACDAISNTTGKGAESVEAASGETQPQAAPLTPTGAPVTLTPEPASQIDDGLQWAASVVDLDPIPGESAKLFGTAGGDPAMNGLYTYIAFYPSPAEGWIVYKIGDFLDYTILSHANGRVDLDIHESTLDDATGNIGSRHRKVIVQWTQAAEDTAPTAVTVTPGE